MKTPFERLKNDLYDVNGDYTRLDAGRRADIKKVCYGLVSGLRIYKEYINPKKLESLEPLSVRVGIDDNGDDCVSLWVGVGAIRETRYDTGVCITASVYNHFVDSETYKISEEYEKFIKSEAIRFSEKRVEILMEMLGEELAFQEKIKKE